VSAGAADANEQNDNDDTPAVTANIETPSSSPPSPPPSPTNLVFASAREQHDAITSACADVILLIFVFNCLVLVPFFLNASSTRATHTSSSSSHTSPPPSLITSPTSLSSLVNPTSSCAPPRITAANRLALSSTKACPPVASAMKISKSLQFSYVEIAGSHPTV